jgi:hypothetical protein
MADAGDDQSACLRFFSLKACDALLLAVLLVGIDATLLPSAVIYTGPSAVGEIRANDDSQSLERDPAAAPLLSDTFIVLLCQPPENFQRGSAIR